MSLSAYKNCRLCQRKCGINRNENIGYCKMSSDMYIARAALHHWEEPPISGRQGSGAIFFSGCSLKCVYCQNREISRGRTGKCVTIDRLSEIMLNLQNEGAHNINLVTPTHYIPSVAEAIKQARLSGLTVPVVYNTASYDTPEALGFLDGLINIYLPDLKYFSSKTAHSYSDAEDYPVRAREAIAEMYRQVGEAEFDENGMMKKGMIVRILLLPGHTAEAMLSLKYLHETYGDKIFVSLMNQYTPPEGMTSPLNRRVTHEEYERLVDYAERIGLKNGFIQQYGTAEESFIPPFDLTGV